MTHTVSPIPDLMRAAVLTAPGAPLEVRRIPTPRPHAGEVLVKVTACGLCHSDLHVIHGAIAFPTPAVLGHEVSGVIVELGPETHNSGLSVGQQICGAFLMPCGQCPDCARGRDDLCSPFYTYNRLKGQLFDGTSRLVDTDGSVIAQYSMGGLAEYCVIPVTAVTPAPDSLDPVAAAILGCAAMTGYGAVRRGAELQYGETVAVIGVGGVGSNIIQIAAEFGAGVVIAIDIDDTKLAAARRLGATHGVNGRTVNAQQAVLEITGGRGVDVAFEALGIPATFTQALDLLADGGRMVPVGLAAGAQAADVPINRLVRRGQVIHGSYGARTRTDLPAVVDLAARDVINYRDVVSLRIPLEKAGETYALLEEGRIAGRAVVDMALAV
ncbi:MAG: zinc-binding dehydrogenase [Propionicimonas sp.]|uniref:zinc-binding dehydrogenase n=1 Tax=Propionicimonas sp. TaxID=1955623 RepID=UPI002B1EFAD4|nr:zinc-binding dehydrogenase [Propionicimonas sp.]MEA4943789.1 zinc-binding dehydrogenase [Propionicimonas sp.]MEA5052543.1 zinc-binding dehydrogenase [Propionicimonas sp.]